MQENVELIYRLNSPKKHSARMSTGQKAPDGTAVQDIYIPKWLLDKLGWDPKDSVKVTYTLHTR